MDTSPIDPDGTLHSRFVNDVMMKILMESPNPVDLPEPDMQQKGEIVLGTLAAINAGVIANLLTDPDDTMAVMITISQLCGITMQEIGRLKPQMRAARNPQ